MPCFLKSQITDNKYARSDDNLTFIFNFDGQEVHQVEVPSTGRWASSCTKEPCDIKFFNFGVLKMI